MSRKLLVIQAAGLGYDLLCKHGGPELDGLTFREMDSVFPAVTCTAQATFRTGLPPSGHGMVFNGFYSRQLRRPFFWEQASSLVSGPRIWDEFRRGGGTVGLLFWQQSLGESADVMLSPAPIHKHHGGMIEDCYSKPEGLYAELCSRPGGRFRLSDYWGPRASAAAGDWIAGATSAVLQGTGQSPDLCLTYLPTLDYDLQRHGPDGERTDALVSKLLSQVHGLLADVEVRRLGYEVLVFGDYAIGGVADAAFPNRALVKAGLMRLRRVGKSLYPDLHASRVFAVADHEVAHVYVADPGDVGKAAEALRGLPNVDVLDRADMAGRGLDHPHSGELLIVAGEGAWLAYPWWDEGREAPDYATHVDIHNKPGYDPCELFFGFPPWKTCQDASRIRGSHGRAGPGRRAAWASTFPIDGGTTTLASLSGGVRRWLEGGQ